MIFSGFQSNPSAANQTMHYAVISALCAVEHMLQVQCSPVSSPVCSSSLPCSPPWKQEQSDRPADLSPTMLATLFMTYLVAYSPLAKGDNNQTRAEKALSVFSVVKVSHKTCRQMPNLLP